MELGVDRPFESNPSARFPVELGLQGGAHIDVSLRLMGTLDPDQADIELHLRDADWLLAEHRTFDWLLDIQPGGWCEYAKARLVFLDEEGGLFPPERLAEVVERPMTLSAQVRTPLGVATSEQTVELVLGSP